MPAPAPGLSSTAMILAAGLGQRMRPITEHTPKPLVRVGGRPLIDHMLDRLSEAGVERAVVNVHHLAERLEAHLAGRARPRVLISDERARLLDSGGGVRRALAHFDGKAFLVANADTLWIEGYRPNLRRLLAHWQPERMDALLLLAATVSSVGYAGLGDFAFRTDGRLERRGERDVAPFVYTGVAILAPDLFRDAPEVFSLNRVFDAALARERLHGLRLDGIWMHVGTPEAIGEAEACLARSAA